MDSDFAQQLRKRTWPEASKKFAGDYCQSVYVQEGRVFSRALRQHQQVSEPIAPGESAITSLCCASNGKIYGATSGAQSHLFYYDPGPRGDGVCDLGVLEGVTAVRRSLVAVAGVGVIAGASEVKDSEEGGALFLHNTRRDWMEEYGTAKGPVERLLVPIKNECIAALTADVPRNAIYGLSCPSGIFFRYDYEAKTVQEYGPVAKDKVFSHTLVPDMAGNVFGATALGTLFRYSPEQDKVVSLQLRIPSVAGREFYNLLDSAILDKESGLIYGAGAADGILFVFDPATLEIRSLGKVTAEPRVRAMSAGHDGRIYGISGCEDGMGHLFRYDPCLHELKDLGLLMAASEVFRHGYEFDAACTGTNGEIYFGESEWESHLFLYFPPYKRPKVTPKESPPRIEDPQ